jgi:hypothetical protein
MTSNKFFENVAKFKCLGITAANQNDFYEEIQGMLATICSESFFFASP